MHLGDRCGTSGNGAEPLVSEPVEVFDRPDIRQVGMIRLPGNLAGAPGQCG